MVGMRIFPVFIACVLLFAVPLYALMPSSTEEMGRFSGDEETASGQIEKEREKIKTEKKNLIKGVSGLREERGRTLRPFVYGGEEGTAGVLAEGFVESSITATPGSKTLKPERPPKQGPSSSPILNLIFFSVIITGFLAAYFFIRPNR